MSTKSYTSTPYITLSIWFLFLTLVQANWDEATGFVHDYNVSPAWLSKNPPKSCSKNIQLAECSHNTRNVYPNVQFMAIFTVDHSKDTFHGCSYGACCYFSAFPPIGEIVPNPTNSHIFIWHKLGGFKGIGTNAIANPQTGVFGWEDGKTGQYFDGTPNKQTYTPAHDKDYPGFKLPPPWPATMPMPAQKNAQPPCGKPGEKNKDPNPTGAPGGGAKTGGTPKEGAKTNGAPGAGGSKPDGADTKQKSHNNNPSPPKKPNKKRRRSKSI